jgi:hypothetical protein
MALSFDGVRIDAIGGGRFNQEGGGWTDPHFEIDQRKRRCPFDA